MNILQARILEAGKREEDSRPHSYFIRLKRRHENQSGLYRTTWLPATQTASAKPVNRHLYIRSGHLHRIQEDADDSHLEISWLRSCSEQYEGLRIRPDMRHSRR
jgi:hypothetical protein